MTFFLFIVAILVQLFAIWAVFYFSLSRTVGSIVTIVVAIASAFIFTAWSLLLGIPLILLSLVVLIDPLRFNLITKPAFSSLGNSMPSISTTEQEALEAGTSWWEKELFMGAPNWDTFNAYPFPQLSEEEQAFIDNEAEQLCSMLDEWEIHQNKDLNVETWQFIKDNGFFGLIIPKTYGGREFSSFAQSRIMSKIASRSLTTAVTCMVPNSLGPGELLLNYGTD
ncbi:MAG: acyl-CoA dehydrogenase family protein, partial [Pluralibacter gergoviae]|nr:acyl-CoA dehydrogenase family protein [Pluralibacter gergoviae]